MQSGKKNSYNHLLRYADCDFQKQFCTLLIQLFASCAYWIFLHTIDSISTCILDLHDLALWPSTLACLHIYIYMSVKHDQPCHFVFTWFWMLNPHSHGALLTSSFEVMFASMQNAGKSHWYSVITSLQIPLKGFGPYVNICSKVVPVVDRSVSNGSGSMW